MPFLSPRVHRVLAFVRPYRFRLLAVVIFLVLSIAIDLSFPAILQQAIDRALLAGDERLLLTLTGALVGLAALRMLVGGISGYLQTWIAAHIVYDMRDHLFSHLLALPMGFFARTKVGDMMSRLHGDITEVQSVATGALVGFVTALLGLLGTIGFLLYYSWKLFLVSCVVTPLAALALTRFRNRIHGVARDVRERNAELASLTVDALGAVRFLRAAGAEPIEQERYRRAGSALMRSLLRFQVVSALGGGLPGSLLVLGAALALLLGGRMVIAGTLTVGALTAFAIYQGRLFGPLSGLMGLYLRLQRARASLDRIFEYLDLAPETPDAPDAVDPGLVRGEVEFADVSFGYEAGRPVLAGVSFRIAPGEHVAVIGASGAGKSTLVDLLWRFYTPDRGTILIDGQDLRRLRRAPLIAQMAVVSQDPHLWNATLGENIRYGRPGATAEEIAAAARAADLGPLLATLERGLATPVGERGAELSAGQRQRVALARALLRQPQILVLDEAMSALDWAAEDQVRRSLAELMAGRTTIVITHRLARAREADQILVLDGGRIVERGRHDELMAAGGMYAGLVARESESPAALPSPAAPARAADPPAAPAPLVRGPHLPGDGRGVKVALVDSGITAPHPHVPRVAGGVTIAVENGIARVTPGFADRNGHGTACAALMAYLAPGAEIHAVKIFDRELRARHEALVAAIEWCAAERIQVVNLSLGTVAGDHLDALHGACRRAVAAGAVLIAAAPRSGPASYPASFPEVIAVGEDRALGDDDIALGDGAGRDFLASGYARPQPDVPTERNFRGSSFAAARLATIVARLLEREPGLDAAAVRTRLVALAAGGGAAPAAHGDASRRPS
jgi:ABC-type multidrug transport system fused ATPase/permease subunit